MNDEQMIKKLVQTAIGKGYQISVYDSEEWTLHRSTDCKEVIDAMFTTDDDRLRFNDADGRYIGSMWLVYGNSPDETICDYSDNKSMNELYDLVHGE